jgi:hypothetical protein
VGWSKSILGNGDYLRLTVAVMARAWPWGRGRNERERAAQRGNFAICSPSEGNFLKKSVLLPVCLPLPACACMYGGACIIACLPFTLPYLTVVVCQYCCCPCMVMLPLMLLLPIVRGLLLSLLLCCCCSLLAVCNVVGRVSWLLLLQFLVL